MAHVLLDYIRFFRGCCKLVFQGELKSKNCNLGGNCWAFCVHGKINVFGRKIQKALILSFELIVEQFVQLFILFSYIFGPRYESKKLHLFGSKRRLY